MWLMYIEWFTNAFVYNKLQWSIQHHVWWLHVYHIWKPHDDVIKWKHFPRYWPFVWGIHRSPVNSPPNGQWRGPLMFSLVCAWTYCWVNNRYAGDLIRPITSPTNWQLFYSLLKPCPLVTCWCIHPEVTTTVYHLIHQLPSISNYCIHLLSITFPHNDNHPWQLPHPSFSAILLKSNCYYHARNQSQ